MRTSRNWIIDSSTSYYMIQNHVHFIHYIRHPLYSATLSDGSTINIKEIGSVQLTFIKIMYILFITIVILLSSVTLADDSNINVKGIGSVQLTLSLSLSSILHIIA